MNWYVGSPPFQWQGNINEQSEQLRGLNVWFATMMRHELAHKRTVTSANLATAATELGIATVFNGSSSYLYVPWTINNTQAITLTCWIRTTTTTSNQYVVSGPQNTIGGVAIDLYIKNSTQIAAAVYNGTTYTEDARTITYSDGKWHHWALTYNGANLRHYWDGVLLGEPTHTGNTVAATNQLWIGKQGAYAGFWFTGNLFDVRGYNRPLTGSEIAAQYNPQTRWELYEIPQPTLWFVPSVTTSIIPLVRHHMAQQGMA